MRMTQSMAARRPRQLTRDAAEMHSLPSVVSGVPAHWQTHPGCTLCLYPTQSQASTEVESVSQIQHTCTVQYNNNICITHTVVNC